MTARSLPLIDTPPPAIYCDRLTVASSLAALRLRRRCRATRLYVLDGIGATRLGRALAWMLRRAGLAVDEMSFFAGHIRTPEGESVCLTACRVATDLSFLAARRLLAEAPLLDALNERAGRNSVLLHVARTLWHPFQEYVVRIMVAQQLSEPGSGMRMLLSRPATFDTAWLAAAAGGTPLHFYAAGWKTRMVKSLRAVAWVAVRPVYGRLRGVVRQAIRRDAAPRSPVRPGLLLVQEDDLSLDPSHRVQPHWLSPEDGRPPFDTYVIRGAASRFAPCDTQGLGRYGISLLDYDELSTAPLPRMHRGCYQDLRVAAFSCLAGAARAWTSPPACALLDAAVLLARAAELVPACSTLQVRVFAAAENYLLDADAIQLIARALRIRTVAFQYSNLTLPNPVMMTNADTMLVFSSLYHDVWSGPGVRPGAFASIGYLFDRRFAHVRVRAAALRRRLERAGASFVICYFDESMQYDRYGLVSADDHRRELLALLQLVLDEPDIAVVVKSQFERNAPARLYGDEPLLRAAAATGRYAELTQGRHRNQVLPAEAALASDLAIGHSVGATAGLEAALAGTRAVLLNPYGMRLLHGGLYHEADVLYDSIDSAIEALRAFRAGDPRRKALGDWTPILPYFDPYRDGQAAVRFRQILETLTGVSDAPAAYADAPALHAALSTRSGR